MLIQIHMLQNYAPSNLNRDETGAPKDATFGGVKRGRISSQCLKRSIRRSTTFADLFAEANLLATRTKRLPGLLAEDLKALGADTSTIKNIIARIPEMGKREGNTGSDNASDSNVLETRILVFLSPEERQQLAEKLLELYQKHGEKDFGKLKIADLEKALQHDMPRSVDIALFGRMTTSVAFENVEAASQVAHAISTNSVAQEFDYFTAVDDISGQSGAGMIGDVEFNSSTYYKYFNIHWEQLLQNLGEEKETAKTAIVAMVEAAAMAQPSGKQNSFAAFNLPDVILVEVSDKNLPVSYANAFIKPSQPQGPKSLMDASVDQLNDYMVRIRRAYGLNGQRAYLAVYDHVLPDADAISTLDDLKSWLKNQLPE